MCSLLVILYRELCCFETFILDFCFKSIYKTLCSYQAKKTKGTRVDSEKKVLNALLKMLATIFIAVDFSKRANTYI